MPRRHLLRHLGLLTALLCVAIGVTRAENGILVIHVKDTQRRPIAGLQIGVEGDGGSAFTNDDGKARIRLAKDTKEKTWVTLQILKSPPGKDYVIVSPWDYKHLVPSFENESDNFVEVVVVQRGDRAALESGTVLAAAVAQINKARSNRKNYVVPLTQTITTDDRVTALKNAPSAQQSGKQHLDEDPKANLAKVAQQYGVAPEDLDRAIRAWGAKTKDPYEAGLAALYERDYPKASADLAESLKQREERLAADQTSVAYAACFLGQSLAAQARFRESSDAYQRCLQLRPNDSAVMNNLGVSLQSAGDYKRAEPLLRSALLIDEKTEGPNHPDVAADLNNLGTLLLNKGDPTTAERLFRRALVINENALGREDPLVAADLNNLGLLLKSEGKYAAAEPLYSRALAIRKKALGPSSAAAADSLNNLAELFHAEGDLKRAESLQREAITIKEKTVGPDHPDLAVSLNNLAEILRAQHDYAEAEPLYKRALAIDEKTLGPDHPSTAIDLQNLALLLEDKGDYVEAEPLIERALHIDEKILGDDHPTTRWWRQHLESLREKARTQKSEK